jgi:class 3 adenylate cyclase
VRLVVGDAWEAVPEDMLENLVRSIPRHIQQVIEREGGALLDAIGDRHYY